jgi:phosphonate transport system permease protein
MVVLRSTPEYVLAYVFLQLRGPSMLPAIAALALHNGGIIGTLTGRHAGTFAIDVYAGETFLGGVTVTGAPGGRTP